MTDHYKSEEQTRDGEPPFVVPQAAVDAAIEFVAMRPEGPARILTLHYSLGNGICAGCAASATRYPCPAARIAELARAHPSHLAHPAPAAGETSTEEGRE